tara:strand:- start:1579 stop:4626 length:3048 start_codon:yes stop_codon:yes gene_type:complete
MAKIDVQILDYDNSVLGTLDITDSENFPLAISYLVSDGRDLDSRFGDFSKSFDIPATKNNNKLFDNIYNAKIDDVKDIVGLKDCRILIDSVDFFNGKIQIKGSRQSSRPLSYSCTIFGGNYGWLSQIKNKNICDTFDRYGELIVNGSFGVQVLSGVSGNWIYSLGSTGLLWYNGHIQWFMAIYKQLDQDVLAINQKLAVGEKYEVSFEITAYTSGSLEGSITNSAGDTSVWSGADGVGVWSYQFIFGDAGTGTNLSTFRLNSGSGGFIGTLDNVSLRSIRTIEYNKTNTENSWTETQATSDIVYPLIDYGEWYVEGHGPYVGNKESEQGEKAQRGHDFRPSFYLYNIIENIFNSVGYQFVSNFIDDVDFKKLICHFPPDEKKLSNQVSEVMISRDYWNLDEPTGGDKGIWDSTISATDYQILSAANANSINSSSFTSTGYLTVINDKVVSDVNGDYDTSTGVWTCPKSGHYDIESVICLVIGDFENTSANQYAKANLNVYVSLWINGTIIQETSDANSQVGSYTFETEIGRDTTTSTTTVGIQSAQYISTTIPMLACVRAEIDSGTRAYTAGDEIEIKVRVKAKAEDPSTTGTITGVRWGVAAVNDIHLRSPTGQYSALVGGLNNVVFPMPAGQIYTSSGSNVGNMWEFYESPYFKVDMSTSDYLFDETYKYSDILPCNISQVNFIKGIANLFNLQFRTDMSRKLVYIEPFNDFYKDKSLSYDWTDKLDLSKEIEDEYNIGLTKQLSFQYKNDSSDGLMKFINDAFKEGGNEYNFFNYFEELGESYNKGITSFVNPVFSSTWCDWDPSLKEYSSTSSRNPALVPVINKEESIYGWDLSYVTAGVTSRPEKLWKYNPRILLYQGLVQSPNHANLPTGWEKFYNVSGNVYSTSKHTTTPRATFVDWDNNSGDKFTNLSFNDEIITPTMTSTPTRVEGLYSVYWKNMIEQLKSNPRIRTMYINLKSSDIATLDLSKLAYINGDYWRINKIVDYAPLKNTTTKVEFIQWTGSKTYNTYT